MNPGERAAAREAKEMTKVQVILKAVNGKLTWLQAADILRVSARQMRRRGLVKKL